MQIFIIISISLIVLALIWILVWNMFFLPDKIKEISKEQAHMEVMEHEWEHHEIEKDFDEDELVEDEYYGK